MKEKGILTLPEESWKKASLRNEIISSLALGGIIEKKALSEAARKLHLSNRQIYRLVQIYRQGDGFITDMALKSPSGGRNKSRLSEPVEIIIQTVLKTQYLTKQKRSDVVIWRLNHAKPDFSVYCPNTFFRKSIYRVS